LNIVVKYSFWNTKGLEKAQRYLTMSDNNRTALRLKDFGSIFLTLFTPSGFTHGMHYFSVKVTQGVTVFSYMIGIGNGSNTTEGLHYGGFCYRSDGTHSPPPGGTVYGHLYMTGDVIGVLVDADSGCIEYFNNGVSQGIAFDDVYTNALYNSRIKDGPLFPAVSLNNTGDGVTLLQYLPYKGDNTAFPWSKSEIIKKKLV